MSPAEVVAVFAAERASAILRTPLEDAAQPAMEAAIAGGFRVCEFTLTTPGAIDLIAEFSRRESIIVGAGTVLTADDAKAAIDAGASFLVSPVVDENVIEIANSLGVTMMPGAHTPTELFRAYRAGAPLQKLFPAPGIGPSFVRACLGPMPFLRIVPTHGVDGDNAAGWLAAGAFAVGFVHALFVREDLESSRFDRIEARARRLLEAVHSAEAMA
jgi:Entner-Doudoroff aldolase